MKHFYLAGALLFVGLIWGLTIPLTKIAVSTGHQPPGLIFWQLLFTVATLTVISTVRRVMPRISRQTLLYFLAVGLLGTRLSSIRLSSQTEGAPRPIRKPSPVALKVIHGTCCDAF